MTDTLGPETALDKAAASRAELVRRRLRGAAPARDRDRITPIPRTGPLPVSFAQRRLWILDQLQPGGVTYLVSTALRLTGELDRTALRAALDGLVARHEPLRTRYREIDGEPVQEIDPPAPVEVTELDLTGLASDAQDARLRALVTAERQPVDLAAGPVFRPTLVRLAERRHALVLTTHHIATDGWSDEVIIRELLSGYASPDTPLPPLSVQYADFAAWQRDRLTGDRLTGHLDYWRSTLAGLTAPELPTDRPRPPVRDSAGDLVPFTVPTPVARALDRLARTHGATPFMLVVSAMLVLLARHTGRTDLAVGTPLAGRQRAETQDMVGLFLNTLVLRADLTDQPSFVDLLARVRETTLAAHAHAELPFERLVDELAPERDPSRTPLFSTLVLWEDAPSAPAELAGLRVEPLPVGETTAKFDLTVGIAERADGSLGGGVNYATALFDRATIARLAGHLTQLLTAIAADPHRPVTALPLLTEPERRQLAEWNTTAVDYPTTTLTELIEHQIATTPDAPAVRFADTTLTFAELDVRANQLAHRLQGLGVGPESIVGVRLPRGAELVVALLAVLKAGGAYLPLDPDYPADRLRYLLADSAATVVIGERAGTEDGVRTITANAPGQPTHPPLPRTDPDHPAYVIYTSGSTGRPKGVLVSHRSIVNRLRWMQDAYHLDATDRVLQKTPSSFDVSVWEFFWPLTTGATLVLARPGGHRDPGYLVELIRSAGVTTLHFVPSMLRVFLTEPFDALPSVRRVICSGEALPADLTAGVHERIGCALHNLYGPTEAAVDVTALHCQPGQPVTIGRPIANTQTYIVDSRLRPVPVGVPGELLLGGVQLARGYHRRAALTAERFVPDPFTPGQRLYRTGDLARYRPDGAIEYLGRTDHQVKIRGHRIELGEIEAVLGEHPDVAAAAVTVHDQQLAAYLTPADVDIAAVRRFLRDRLPEQLVPTHWVPLAELPLTSSGKTDRGALPAPSAARPDLAGDYTAPRDELERRIAAAFAAATGVDRVGVHDRFFDLGGDSIRAIRMVGALRAAGLGVSVQHVFTHQSVAELATVVQPAESAQERLVAPFELISPADRAALPAGLADAYPMGQVQAGMVYEMLADPDEPTYQNVTSFEMLDDGPFSLPALETALRMLIDRHEILRTSFDLSGYTEPMQLVHVTAPAEVGYTDLRGQSEPEQRAAVAEFTARARRTPLDVGAAPLLRHHVHHLDEHRWLLTHIECHAILDGWSHHSLIAELRATYRAMRVGQPDPLAAHPPVRYADFIALERKSLASEVDREFWRDRLTRFGRIELPPDAAPGEPGHEVQVWWAPQEDRLRELARQTRTSLKTVLHTAHLVVMGLLTGQRRFFGGTVANGRPESADGEQVRGMYLNTVPFAVDLTAPTWRELVASVFAEESALWPHRRFPLPVMQREWGQGRQLVEALFAYLDFHVMDERRGDFGAITDHSPNEFTLDVWTFPGELRLACRAGWATERRLTDIATAYLDVLAAMTDDPDANPADFRAPSLAAGPVSVVDDPADERTVPDLVAAHAHARPDDIAVDCGQLRLTNRELDERTNQLAHLLRASGLDGETPVAVCLDRGAELVVAELGILKAGGYYVPLDPEHPADRHDLVLTDTGAAALVTSPDLADRFTARTDLRVITLDPSWRQLAGQPTTTPVVDIAPDNVAYGMYTSGSTGRPKGALVTHRNIVRLVAGRVAGGRRYVRFGPGEAGLLMAPVAFDASALELWSVLCNGAKLGVFPPGTPTAADIEAAVRRHGVTVLWLTAGLFQHVVDVRPSALHGVTRVMSGGDVISPAHARQVLEMGIAMTNGYGPTECSTFSTAHPDITVADTAGAIPVGLPIAQTYVHVVDERLRPVPPGVPGELLIGGTGVGRGYLGRPDLTAARFIPDPLGTVPGARMYRSGDMVRQDPDGMLHFLGRRDHQVKIRGHRIELAEVEAGIANLPVVRAAAARVWPGPDGSKRLVGYVVLQPGVDLGPTELGDRLRQRVPEFLVPSSWVVLDAMPLSGNEKIDRSALPEPVAASPAGALVAPGTDTERAIAAVWAEALGVERVSVRDDFYALGGHSLLILRIIALLRERHGIELTVRAFAEHRTVERLAALVAARAAENAADQPVRALHWLRRTGTRTPLLCVHPGGGSAHWYRPLAELLDPDQPVAVFEWPGLQTEHGPVPTTEQMADRYYAELRADLPHGPYRLFGWCGGSGIASELAHRMAADGEPVTFVLLDPSLDCSRRAHLWRELWLIERLVRLLETLAATGPEADTTELRAQTLRLLEHIVDDVDPAVGITLPEPGAGDGWLPAARIWREVMEMMMAYEHRPYAGGLHLIVSDELARGEHEVAAGQEYDAYTDRWRELTGELALYRIPGDHFSVVKEPHVARLADTLTAILAEADEPAATEPEATETEANETAATMR